MHVAIGVGGTFLFRFRRVWMYRRRLQCDLCETQKKKKNETRGTSRMSVNAIQPNHSSRTAKPFQTVKRNTSAKLGRFRNTWPWLVYSLSGWTRTTGMHRQSLYRNPCSFPIARPLITNEILYVFSTLSGNYAEWRSKAVPVRRNRDGAPTLFSSNGPIGYVLGVRKSPWTIARSVVVWPGDKKPDERNRTVVGCTIHVHEI